MSSTKVSKPIFFIGNPRSGTTLIFEAFAKHPELAWLMNYSNIFPKMTLLNCSIPLLNNKFINLIGQKKQHNSTSFLNKYMPRPDECYHFWAVHMPDVDFSRDFLLEKEANSETISHMNQIFSNICKYQNKERFTTKLTGPGRISFLNSLFPDAIFIHIVRDGRSVVQSLMKVGFWQDKMHEPWFTNGLTKEDFKIWEESDKDPAILTTLLWNRIIETTQAEALKLDRPHERYLEVKYEDFIKDPNKVVKEIFQFSDLEGIDEVVTECLAGTNIIKSMNKKFNSQFTDEKQNDINTILSANLKKFNYIIGKQ